MDWVLKIQDWFWIAKYDSPLISDAYIVGEIDTL